MPKVWEEIVPFAGGPIAKGLYLKKRHALSYTRFLSITFHALSQEVTWAQCLLFSAATVLTRLANIVSGGLGVREGIIATVAIVALGVPYTYILSKNATLNPESNDCE